MSLWFPFIEKWRNESATWKPFVDTMNTYAIEEQCCMQFFFPIFALSFSCRNTTKSISFTEKTTERQKPEPAAWQTSAGVKEKRRKRRKRVKMGEKWRQKKKNRERKTEKKRQRQKAFDTQKETLTKAKTKSHTVVYFQKKKSHFSFYTNYPPQFNRLCIWHVQKLVPIFPNRKPIFLRFIPSNKRGYYILSLTRSVCAV